jgi:chromosome segregation ATPase
MSKSKVEITSLEENLKSKKDGLEKQDRELKGLLSADEEKKKEELESIIYSSELEKANNEILNGLKREKAQNEDRYKALKPVEARRDELSLKIKELQADVKRLEDLNAEQLVVAADESPRSK